ncbi:MAG TPA: hypothetical protein VFB84_14465 [Micromonosporaceae bacterium]|nr:hypothetical protein [Micromonosporaceae bacterium]
MRALAAAETLAVWEQAHTAPPELRPAALLAAAYAAGAFGLLAVDTPEAAVDAEAAMDAPETLPVGRRDALLLRLYAAMFADRLDGLSRCPQCATTVELAASCAVLLAAAPPDPGARVEPVVHAGHTVRWRLPDTRDLVAIGGCADPADGADLLLDRCVVEAGTAHGPVVPADLPAGVRAAVAQAMAAADPLAEVTFALDCPQCSARWESPLDVGEFVWARLRARADQLMREVDALARAYGWPEAEILGLSADRRAAYLRLVADG